MSRAKTSALPYQDEVWIVDLDPAVGHEQGGVRPALVVSSDRFNRSPSGLVTIASVTGTDRGLIAHVRVDPPEGGLVKTSFIMTDQVRTISRLRLGKRLGVISPATRAEVEVRLRIHLAL
jgi:mRNA interferase MazF